MTLAYILWCGAAWVLRGGAFGKLYRWARGIPDDQRPEISQLTRVVCSGLMAAPLAFVIGWDALWLWPSIWAAMCIGYYGAAMGLNRWRDYPLMAAWGASVAFVATAPLHIRFEIFFDPFGYAIYGDPLVAAWAAFGALAAAAYAVNKPFGRRYGTDWTERAEFLTGCAMGAAIIGAAT